MRRNSRPRRPVFSRGKSVLVVLFVPSVEHDVTTAIDINQNH